MPDRGRFAARCAALSFCSIALLWSLTAAGAVQVFRHARILPVASAPIEDGALVIEDGVIRAVGVSADIPTPDAPRSSILPAAW